MFVTNQPAVTQSEGLSLSSLLDYHARFTPTFYVEQTFVVASLTLIFVLLLSVSSIESNAS